METKSKVHEFTESSMPKYAMLVALGLINYDSSHAYRTITLPTSQRSSVVAVHMPTSTRVNVTDRYSLDKLKLNKRTLFNLRNLQHNWNGYNAEPINNDIIDKTERLISMIHFQPQIFPTGRGTIQIEYYNNDDDFMEIEIFDDGQFMYRIKDGLEEEREVSIEEIIELI